MFIISGYLFFRNNQTSFTWVGYLNKIQSRTRSLLIPYLFWNTFVMLCYAMIHLLAPNLIDPENNNVLNYSFLDFIRAYWDGVGGQPICFQFWFIRDLMVGVILSPIVFYIAKYGKWFAAIVLLINYISKWFAPPYYIMFTFFCLGAICAINEYDFTQIIKPKIVIPISVVFLSLIVLNSLTAIDNSLYLDRLQVILGIITYIGIATAEVERGKQASRFLLDATFFVYAFHALPLLLLTKGLLRLLNPTTQLMWIFCYLFAIIFIIVFSLSLYYCLRKYFPKSVAFICGSR